MKNVIKVLTPPLIWGGLSATKNAFTSKWHNHEAPGLFCGYNENFISAVEGVQSYGEYGLGASTRWVDENTNASIKAVDTSSVWVQNVQKSLKRSGHELIYVDVGPVGEWGWPIGFNHLESFIAYVEGIWDENQNHDLVLIDGRFRIACFLTSMIRANPGCKIIFDDYVERPMYHVVERFQKPILSDGRQATFVVPETRDIDALTKMRDQFLMVRE